MEKGQDPLFYPSCLLFLESVFCICFFACKNRKGKGKKKKSIESIIIKVGPGGWGAA